MRFNDFNISDPVEELAKQLPNLKKIDYDAIDELMQKICSKHKLSGEKLHDMFVKKYKHTPDTWVKKIKQRNEEVTESYKGVLGIGSVTDKIHSATNAAKHLNAKVVKTAGGYYKIASLDDPRPAVEADSTYFSELQNIQKQIKDIESKMQAVNWKHHSARFKVFDKCELSFEKNSPEYRDCIVKGIDTINAKYFKTPEYVEWKRKLGELKVKLKSLKDAGKRAKPVSESVDDDQDVERLKHFVEWSKKVLHIQGDPQFHFSRDTEQAQTGHHTGLHTGNDIWVYIENRNLVDIFRTVFHELVHQRQEELGMIKDGDSYPGSPIEAMADMLAGKYIKIYGKEHNEIFQ